MTKSANFWTSLLAVAMLIIAYPVIARSAQTDVGINVLKEGTGEEAVRHSRVKVHYTGWLQDGTEFDSSRDRGEPFEFTIGAGQVIPGWDLGIKGMRSGGKRELTIPPQLAYGKNGAGGGTIPPNATLKFEVELISVSPPKYSNVDNMQLKALLKRGVKVLDIRRADEWKQTGIVKGSKLITAFDGSGRFVSSFRDKLRAFSGPNEELILICRTGNRSSVIANALAEQAGYSNIYNVTDGIMKWIKDGNPVVR